MKTTHLSSEANGVSIAVNVGTEKPIYVTPTGLRALFALREAIEAELASIDPAVLDGIDARAALDPEGRKKARVAARRAELEAKLAAATNDAERNVATLELQLFNAKNA